MSSNYSSADCSNMLFPRKISKPEGTATVEESMQQDVEKTSHNDGRSKDTSGEKTESVDVFSGTENVQAGVQAIEAATSVWTKGHLITAYIMYVDYRLCSSIFQF